MTRRERNQKPHPKKAAPSLTHLGTVASMSRPGLRWSIYLHGGTAEVTCTCPKREGCSHIQKLLGSDANARMRVERARYASKYGSLGACLGVQI